MCNNLWLRGDRVEEVNVLSEQREFAVDCTREENMFPIVFMLYSKIFERFAQESGSRLA
jgi:hypothetical protein